MIGIAKKIKCVRCKWYRPITSTWGKCVKRDDYTQKNAQKAECWERKGVTDESKCT